MNKNKNFSFDWVQYLVNYPDLKNAGINNSRLALRHYQLNGLSEGRTDKKIIQQVEQVEQVKQVEQLKIIDPEPENESNKIEQEIIIVYYIYINPNKDWKSIISGQIQDLRNINLLNHSKLFCVICTPYINLFNECTNLIKSYSEEVNYYHVTENNFEYPGIKKLHELGTLYPEKIFLYMHSKGMVFHETEGRNNHEMQILRNTIKYWKYTLNIFKNYPFIDKAGLFPDPSGIIWYNFFWIRGSFLKGICPPIITNNRYYYEHRYIINKNNENNCFNLLCFDMSRYSQIRACCLLFKNNLDIKNFFNIHKYISKYPDIKELNKKQILKHFITHGIDQNRNLI